MDETTLDRLFRPLDRIPGPDFLVLFLLLLATAFVVSAVFSHVTRPRPVRDPSLFELAHLCQGPAGVVATSHLLADQPPPPSGPDAALLRSAAASHLHARIQAARPGLAGQSVQQQADSPEVAPAIEALRDHLHAEGFIRARPNPALRLTHGMFAALFLFGVLRAWRGVVNDRPTVYLAVLLAVLVLVWTVAIRLARRNPEVGRILRRLRRLYGVRRATASVAAPLPVAYTLGGGALLWATAPALANEYQVSAAASSSGSSGGSASCGSSSGDSSSSCGGGGGCGGCGGGD